MDNYQRTEWTDSEIKYLKENYQNKSYKILIEEMNRSRSSIQHKLHRLGLKKNNISTNKKVLNDSYFETINSSEKAYWLGFIAADGHINNYRKGSYGFKITLQKKDHLFLQKFLKDISAEFELKFPIHKKGNQNYEMCEVSFCSKKFVTDLLQYISYNKTHKINLPNINVEYISDYIRGFSDGDGCFYLNTNGRIRASFEIVAYDNSILKDIQNEFNKVGIKSTIYQKQNGNYKLGIYSRDSFIKLHHYLYDDATIFMQRKYEKSLKIITLAA